LHIDAGRVHFRDSPVSEVRHLFEDPDHSVSRSCGAFG
jgi:hypothetical protein